MSKPISFIGFTLAISATLIISACSNIEETAPVNKPQEQKQEQVIAPEVTESQPIPVQPVITTTTINTASLTDLTAIFAELNYQRSNCTADQCAIPRITFNRVGEDWKESSTKLATKVKKELFFRMMTPLILMANEKIQAEREVIKSSDINSAELKAIALKYRVIKDAQSTMNEGLRTALLQRVDILPASLALAQAAEESGWATSRFAREGNAFFGQWDYSGNGMKPLRQRTNLGNYGVARFATPLASVEGYMLNLNSNGVYQKLRTLRAQLRSENKAVTGYTLAGTLDRYSERKEAYTKGLRSIISYNKLAPLDQAYLTDTPVVNIEIN